jgi:hypothetical protein
MFEQTSAVEGPSPEGIIARDLVRRGLIIAPALVIVFGLIWGIDGALSTLYGLAIVLGNFMLAAALLNGAARISPTMMMIAAMFGYLVRLALIFLAIWLVSDAPWVELVPLGITIIGTHLGLLLWEVRFVSASLAYPALKPNAPSRPVSKETSPQ